MQNQLDILGDVTKRFDQAGINYMLTGSFALNYYAEPRMTRDIDLVVVLIPGDAERLVDRQSFSNQALLLLSMNRVAACCRTG
jgi:hypothetical protein